MSEDDREAEDVAGLFRKFGGDVKGYREFEPAPVAGQPPAAWTLIPGAGTPTQAAEPAPAPVAATPQPTAPAPVPAPAPAPSIPAPRHAEPAAPPAVAAPASAFAAPRELDLLFARLAGQPPSTPTGSHGLMSRWRKPS
ncbi:hypothetical protein [Variovorax saccharolyticus]|uniref:hypothetical protein n=1 Tax=Variovorax saccharolyticus TaxID=3053516 RepID=UPI0025781D18|nr:hypothetical protein [Variovorax sp. J22R187]MDM0020204.1 hypothetical protein [Variovorax sp. J22R187]